MAVPMTAAQVLAAMKLWGVPCKEWPGWKTRGRDPEHGPFRDVHGIVIHHTGSDIGQSDDYLDFLATRGRPGLPGPLCNAATDMDGDLWLVAQGRANHAGSGSSATYNHVTNEDYQGYKTELRPGPDNIDGNAVYYGNEVRYDGGQPMTAKQYTAVTRWAAAICHFHGWSALSIIGHREHTGRKNDPGNCPMNTFRSDVAALLKAGPSQTAKPPTGSTPSKPTEDDMQLTDLVTYNKVLYGTGGTEGVWNAALHRKLDLLITGIANLKLAVAKVDADDAEDDAQHAAVMAQLAEINQMLADAPEPEPVPKA